MVASSRALGALVSRKGRRAELGGSASLLTISTVALSVIILFLIVIETRFSGFAPSERLIF